MQHIIDRFISYVIIDTESDAKSETTPSTPKQLVLAKLLVKELKAIGLTEVTIDKNGYVMGTLASNVDHEVPTIGFVSHYDTTPDFTGKDVERMTGKICEVDFARPKDSCSIASNVWLMV